MHLALQDNLSVQVAKLLAEKIICAEYPAGSRVMEIKIAQELGISRGPVREALLILQKQRLVNILPRRGAVVRELSANEIKEIYDVITALYILLAEKVAIQWQDDNLAPFAATLKLMKALAKQGDHVAYFQQTIEFIRLGIPIVKNKLLEELIEDLMPCVCRVQYRSIQQRRTNLKEHWQNYAQILAAVEERKVHKIAKIVTDFNAMEQRHAISLITN